MGRLANYSLWLISLGSVLVVGYTEMRVIYRLSEALYLAENLPFPLSLRLASFFVPFLTVVVKWIFLVFFLFYCAEFFGFSGDEGSFQKLVKWTGLASIVRVVFNIIMYYKLELYIPKLSKIIVDNTISIHDVKYMNDYILINRIGVAGWVVYFTLCVFILKRLYKTSKFFTLIILLILFVLPFLTKYLFYNSIG